MYHPIYLHIIWVTISSHTKMTIGLFNWGDNLLHVERKVNKATYLKHVIYLVNTQDAWVTLILTPGVSLISPNTTTTCDSSAANRGWDIQVSLKLMQSQKITLH